MRNEAQTRMRGLRQGDEKQQHRPEIRSRTAAARRVLFLSIPSVFVSNSRQRAMLALHSQNDPSQVAAYLRTLPAIRERCSQVFELGKAGKLEYFAYHPEKEESVAEFCDSLIAVSERVCVWMMSADPPHRGISARTSPRFSPIRSRSIGLSQLQ
jgi:hypothetical protein